MKIGIDISVLNDHQRTGIGVYTYELLKALLKINKEDQFILFGIGTLSTYNYLKNLEFKDYPNVQMKIFKMPAKAFRTAFLLWQKLNWPLIEYFIGQVDIFHSFNWFLPPQRSGKSVATVFDLTSILFPQWHDYRTSQLDKLRFERVAQKADLVVAISESTKKDWQKLYFQTKVEVVYPACREVFKKDQKEEKEKRDKVMRKYGLQPGYLLSVGTLEPRKNLEGLVRAYTVYSMKFIVCRDKEKKSPSLNTKYHILNTFPKLVLVGKSGWKNEELMKLINQYPEQIKMLGFVPDEDLKVLYQQALAFIYPSFYEGFGIPVLESLSCGCPVITSNTSSLPEVGGKAAVYVRPGDQQGLIRELGEIGKNKGRREEMITLGLEQAEKFSWERSARKLNQIYQKVVK